ncbi:hypothetical protein [Pedobacter hartonius]|uniref:Uncharacterized protein n=1 Tax=Pedobacter hartonius TaxID=425514 RepID=A0A1H4HKI7_9SPHI|nr:hypothetical protein [Pedobacter hartonius]SEB21558.1 hypothetical protein SAMN05443550_12024 [Pedobacter hartonius]
MPNRYFKAHEAYNLNPNRYDIGTIIGLKNGYEDNLFIKKLFTLHEAEYLAFYQYHLDYFLGKEAEGEEEFFTFVWQIVLRRINFIEHKNPFNSSHALDMEILAKLLHFQKYLRSIDQWHTQKTLPEIIADQHEVIRKQQSEIADLTAEIKEFRQWDGYIIIRDGQALAILDLCLQMQKLEASDGKELLITPAQKTWAKMISKYFREVDEENLGEVKEIKMDKLRHYLRGIDLKDPQKRENKIPEKHLLYTITPAKKKRK